MVELGGVMRGLAHAKLVTKNMYVGISTIVRRGPRAWVRGGQNTAKLPPIGTRPRNGQQITNTLHFINQRPLGGHVASYRPLG